MIEDCYHGEYHYIKCNSHSVFVPMLRTMMNRKDATEMERITFLIPHHIYSRSDISHHKIYVRRNIHFYCRPPSYDATSKVQYLALLTFYVMRHNLLGEFPSFSFDESASHKYL